MILDIVLLFQLVVLTITKWFNMNYTIPVEKGMLIVAYPNENVDDTEFEFTYNVETEIPKKT